MWALEHYDVVPDILTSAKSLGGGLVLSAVVARREIMESVDIGGLGGTFGGNPLSCAAALAVLEEIEEKNLITRAVKLGEIVTGRLKEMQQKYQIMGDVRGLGSFIAIEFVRDRESKVPATAECNEVRLKCLECGLLVMTCGVAHNCFRMMYPLVIEESELAHGLDIIENAIREVNQKIA
jgi:4-aminobutyrate aminotransferase/(S)-3-amino-2-methylpropionate transaminase